MTTYKMTCKNQYLNETNTITIDAANEQEAIERTSRIYPGSRITAEAVQEPLAIVAIQFYDRLPNKEAAQEALSSWLAMDGVITGRITYETTVQIFFHYDEAMLTQDGCRKCHVFTSHLNAYKRMNEAV